MALKKLNKKGISQFENYLAGGANGPPPLYLLDDPVYSETVSAKISPPDDISVLPDRYVFGNRLNDLLKDLNPTEINMDKGLWSGLALLWFDVFCPSASGGKRTPGAEYRYILSPNYKDYYRHLVRSPWRLVCDHGKNAKFALIAPRAGKNPLAVNGEIFENICGRQQVLANRKIIEAANRLYFDVPKNRPKTGVAGSGKGSARRFGLIFRQFDLTYDPASMPTDALTGLLPSEFERWKLGQ